MPPRVVGVHPVPTQAALAVHGRRRPPCPHHLPVPPYPHHLPIPPRNPRKPRLDPIHPANAAIPELSQPTNLLLEPRDHARIEPIVPLVLFGANDDPLVIAQYAQVMLRRRAPHAELASNDFFDNANLVLAAREDLDNPAANRLTEHFEGMHDFFMSVHAYVRVN